MTAWPVVVPWTWGNDVKSCCGEENCSCFVDFSTNLSLLWVINCLSEDKNKKGKQKWDLFLKEIYGFLLNVTDHYCISPATSKGGFSCHRDLSRKCHLHFTGHVSHRSEAKGLLPRITRQSETFFPPSLPLALFYPREWRVCPHLCWENVLVYLVFPALFTLI